MKFCSQELCEGCETFIRLWKYNQFQMSFVEKRASVCNSDLICSISLCVCIKTAESGQKHDMNLFSENLKGFYNQLMDCDLSPCHGNWATVNMLKHQTKAVCMNWDIKYSVYWTSTLAEQPPADFLTTYKWSMQEHQRNACTSLRWIIEGE